MAPNASHSTKCPLSLSEPNARLLLRVCVCANQVLAVAPSNVAVDNIVERLAVRLPGSAPNVLRIGHPARMTPAVLQHCLDAKIQVLLPRVPLHYETPRTLNHPPSCTCARPLPFTHALKHTRLHVLRSAPQGLFPYVPVGRGGHRYRRRRPIGAERCAQ